MFISSMQSKIQYIIYKENEILNVLLITIPNVSHQMSLLASPSYISFHWFQFVAQLAYFIVMSSDQSFVV